MSSDPTLPTDQAYRNHVTDEQHYLRVSETVQLIGEMIIDFNQVHNIFHPQDIDLLQQHVRYLNGANDDKSEIVHDKIVRYNQAQELKALRNDELIVPADQPESVRMDIKELKAFVGQIDENSKVKIKEFFNKLFRYGLSQRYSWNNYKIALTALLQGEYHVRYDTVEHRDFEGIAQWFYKLYHRPETMQHYVDNMKAMERYPAEDIEVFMQRYLINAEAADRHLPETQMYYTLELHAIKVIEKALTGKAKQDFQKWRNEQVKGGFWFDYKSSLAQAIRCEEYHNLIPTETTVIDCTNVHDYGYENLNAIDFQNRNRRDYVNNKNSGNKNDNKGKPKPRPSGASLEPLDPHKAAGFRSPFYASVKKQQEEKEKMKGQGGAKSKAPKPLSKGSGPQGGGSSFGKGPGKGDNTSKAPPKTEKVKHWYCFLCGVPNDSNAKWDGWNHTTPNCPFYKNYTSTLCRYCHDHLKLRANHYQKVCRRMPKSYKEVHEHAFVEPPASEFEGRDQN